MAIQKTIQLTVAGQAVNYDAKNGMFNFAGPIKSVNVEDARDFCKFFYANTGKPRGRKAAPKAKKA